MADFGLTFLSVKNRSQRLKVIHDYKGSWMPTHSQALSMKWNAFWLHPG